MNLKNVIQSILALGATFVISSAAQAIPVGTCSGFGGVVNGNNCYIVNNSTLTWTTHEATAQSLDPSFHLTSILSPSENGFIRGLITGAFWIGLNDIASEGVYVWTDGSPTGYLFWAPGEPNNYNNEDAVQMTVDPWWNDLPPYFSLPAVYKAQIDSGADNVPEPASLALFGFGLAGLSFGRRKKAIRRKAPLA